MHRKYKITLATAAAVLILAALAAWTLPQSPGSAATHHEAPFSWHWDHGLHVEVLWDELTADNVNHTVLLGRETGMMSYTPLQLAVVMKEYKMVELLLDAGADIEGRVRLDGSTPLMTAALWNDAKMVQLLIRQGANVSAVTEGEWCFEETDKGKTALDIAKEADSADCVQLLQN